MKRTLSLAVSLALLCTLAVPAGAEPAADGLTVHWLEAGPGYEIFRWPGENRALSVRDGKYGLIDLEGKTLYPCELDMVVPSGSGGYLANKDGGWSGMGTLGNLYDESFSYPTMEMARDGRTVRVDVQEGKGCGVVDLEGNRVVPYRYWNGKDSTEGLAAVEDTNGLWGYIDLEGHTVIPHRYVFAEPFQDGLAPVAAGIGRWGLVDAAGMEVVPCVYFAVGYAGEGMYWLRYTENLREKLAFANDRGQIVTEGWDYLTGNKGQMEGGSFSGGVAQVWRDGNAQWIDWQGTVVQAPAQPEDNTYHEGLRRMEHDGKWGFADEAGELVVPCIYDGVGDFDQGVAAVRVGDRWGFLENPLNQRRGTELSITWLEAGGDPQTALEQARASAPGPGEYRYEDWGGASGKTYLIQNPQGTYDLGESGVVYQETGFTAVGETAEGITAVYRDGKWGYVERNFVLYDPVFDEARDFHEGVAVVRQEDKYGLAENSRILLVEPTYEDAGTCSEWLVAVKLGGKWGYVDKYGREVIPFRFDSAGDFQSGLALVTQDGKTGILDHPLLNIETDRETIPLRGFNALSYGPMGGEGFKDGRYGYLAPNGAFFPLPEGVHYATGYEETELRTVCKGDRYGAADRDGNLVVPLEYPRVEAARIMAAAPESLERYGAAVEWRDGGFGVVDRAGNTLVPFQYPRCDAPYANGAVMLFHDGPRQCSFFDTSGQAIGEPVYGWSDPFGEDGLAIVSQWDADNDGKFGVIDLAGETVIPFEYGYNCIQRAGEGMFGLWSGGGVAFANSRGETVTAHKYHIMEMVHTPSVVPHFQNGLAAVQSVENDLWGYIDTQGREVIPCRYFWGSSFDGDGYAWVQDVNGGEEYCIDRQGNRVPDRKYLFEPEKGQLSEGLKTVKWGDKYGYLDAQDRLVVPCDYYEAGEFYNGVALVLDGEGHSFLKNPLKKDTVSDWAKAEVDRAKDLDLVPVREARYYTYDVTRLQFAELAVNLVEKTAGQAIEPAEPGRFTDTDDLAARKAAAAGIVNGTGDGSTFSPDAPITREQLAAMLCRAMGWTEAGTTDLAAYDDGADVAPWARETVATLVERGILQGADNALSPQDYTTVEQAILLILRSYEQGGIEG